MLRQTGYNNPCVFAMEYPLAPEAPFPEQVDCIMVAYAMVLENVDATRVCIAGDSAGANLLLSFLVRLDQNNTSAMDTGIARSVLAKPAMAVLISPWVTLDTMELRPKQDDYLDPATLERYADMYVGEVLRHRTGVRDMLASPGAYLDRALWKRAAPKLGFYITRGADEVLAPDVERFFRFLLDAGIPAELVDEEGRPHAWPVAAMFLSSSNRTRADGVKRIAKAVRLSMPGPYRLRRQVEKAANEDAVAVRPQRHARAGASPNGSVAAPLAAATSPA